MNTCSLFHDSIAYVGFSCPLCKHIRIIKNLEKEVIKLEQALEGVCNEVES